MKRNSKPLPQPPPSTQPGPRAEEHQPQLQSVRDSLVEDVVVPLEDGGESLWLGEGEVLVVGSSEVSVRYNSRESRSRPFRSQTTPRRRVTTVRRARWTILDSEGVSDVVSWAVTILHLHIFTFSFR